MFRHKRITNKKMLTLASIFVAVPFIGYMMGKAGYPKDFTERVRKMV